MSVLLLWKLIGIGTVLLIVGLGWWAPLDLGAVLLDSLKYSFSALLLFLILVVRPVKKRWTSPDNGIGSSITLSLVAFPLLVFGIEMALNALLDFSPSTAHTVRVLEKSTSRSVRAGRSYTVEVESWQREGEVAQLDVSRLDETTFVGIMPNRTRITVITKPGCLGFEWVTSYKVEPS